MRGGLWESLHSKGANVTGVDISGGNSYRKKHAEKEFEINYLNCEAEDLLPDQNSYDLVTCLEAIEHVPEPAKLVKICSDLCKSGGTIVFSTINRNPKSFLFAIVGAEYVLNLLPKGTHEYKVHQTSELSSMMRDNSLEVCEVKGMSYNPITKNYWLGKNVDVNYLIHAKKDKDYKQIFFDLDGTLLDTAPEFSKSNNLTLNRLTKKLLRKSKKSCF